MSGTVIFFQNDQAHGQPDFTSAQLCKKRSTRVLEYTMCSYRHRESNERVMMNTLFLGYIAITR